MRFWDLRIFSDIPPITQEYVNGNEFKETISNIFCNKNCMVYNSVFDKKAIALQLRYLGFVATIMSENTLEFNVTELVNHSRSSLNYTGRLQDCILYFDDITENFCSFRADKNCFVAVLYVFCNVYEFTIENNDLVLTNSYETRGYTGNVYKLIQRLLSIAEEKCSNNVGMNLF